MNHELLHIVPTDDSGEHQLDGLDCPCHPALEHSDGTLLVIHRAYDLRDLLEPFFSEPPTPTVTN